MQQEIFFSVVIPLYNRESLIDKTIESVLKQDTDRLFEVIVVDDGSKDKSADVVKSIEDNRITYVYQQNAGANVARNRGIDLAKGKYIALLDSDDVFLPDHLSTSARLLDENPDMVVYAKIIVDRGEGNTFTKPPRAIAQGEHMSDYLLRDRGFLQTSTLVVPTKLAQRVRFDDELPFGQDTDFAIRLFAEGTMFHMKDEPAVIWRDVFDDKRISSKSRPNVRENWLEKVKPHITKRAYLGDKGWFVAKAYAQQGNRGKALSYYLTAVFNRCYSIKHTLVVGLQIFCSPAFYRKLADKYISKKT